MDQPALDEFVARARGPARREELDAAAVEALDAFEAAGVEALLLKGPVLARVLYSEGERRGYTDIDLLVSPGQFAAARQALAGLGYERADEAFGVEHIAGAVHGELWAQRGEVGALWVDLHLRLGGCEAPVEAAWAALWTRRASIDFHGRNTAVLGKDGLALHLALHAAQHGTDDTKAMADLGRGIERLPAEVWREAERLAQALQALPAFAAGLRLLPAGIPLAERLGLPEHGRLEWEIQHRGERPRGTFHLEAFARAHGVKERINVLRRSLIPTPQWIGREYSWAAGGRSRLIAGYAAHLARTPLWAYRALRFRLRAHRQRDDAL